MNKAQQPQPKVTLSLHPGPLTPAQKQAHKRFWLKLTAAAKGKKGVR